MQILHLYLFERNTIITQGSHLQCKGLIVPRLQTFHPMGETMYIDSCSWFHPRVLWSTIERGDQMFVCLLIYVLLFRAAQFNPMLGTSFERNLPNLVALYDKHEAYFSPGGCICDVEKGALKHSLTAWLYLPLTIFQIR